MLRRNYADAWNTQAKFVCSYASQKNMYQVNEGQPIVDDWDYPQNRLGIATDSNLPADVEQNALVRDELMEKMKVQFNLHFHFLFWGRDLEPRNGYPPVST